MNMQVEGDARLIQYYLGYKNIRQTVRYLTSNLVRFKDVWISK